MSTASTVTARRCMSSSTNPRHSKPASSPTEGDHGAHAASLAPRRDLPLRRAPSSAHARRVRGAPRRRRPVRVLRFGDVRTPRPDPALPPAPRASATRSRLAALGGRSRLRRAPPPPPRRGATAGWRGRDHYVIDGHKWFSSGAHGAAFAIVMAKTNPEQENPYLSFGQIIVPTDTPGFHIE